MGGWPSKKERPEACIAPQKHEKENANMKKKMLRRQRKIILTAEKASSSHFANCSKSSPVPSAMFVFREKYI